MTHNHGRPGSNSATIGDCVFIGCNDSIHPSDLTQYTNACVLYAMITGQSPIGLGDASSGFANITMLQETAWNTYLVCAYQTTNYPTVFSSPSPNAREPSVGGAIPPPLLRRCRHQWSHSRVGRACNLPHFMLTTVRNSDTTSFRLTRQRTHPTARLTRASGSIMQRGI